MTAHGWEGALVISWREAKYAEVATGSVCGASAGSFLPGDEAGLAPGPGELWSLAAVGPGGSAG